MDSNNLQFIAKLNPLERQLLEHLALGIQEELEYPDFDSENDPPNKQEKN